MKKLIKCKTCEKEISKTAKSCPHCGCSDPYNNMRNVLIGCFIFFILCLGSCVTCISSIPEEDPNSWRSEDNSIGAYIMMEGFIKDRLRSPASAEFPGVFDGKLDHVKYLGDRKYIITSYVDSQNGYGAMIRSTFIGEIEQINKDHWSLKSLVIN